MIPGLKQAVCPLYCKFPTRVRDAIFLIWPCPSRFPHRDCPSFARALVGFRFFASQTPGPAPPSRESRVRDAIFLIWPCPSRFALSPSGLPELRSCSALRWSNPLGFGFCFANPGPAPPPPNPECGMPSFMALPLALRAFPIGIARASLVLCASLVKPLRVWVLLRKPRVGSAAPESRVRDAIFCLKTKMASPSGFEPELPG